ncbi:MAG: VgrG protein [Nitrospira sp.]|jgi:phage protein D|nr:MAG: VgrG protein [Nitrospira sp.]
MARYSQFGPQFTVQIGGANLPAGLRGSISSLTLTAGLEGSNSVEITFANPNLQWLDHPLLAVDQPLTLSIGYAPDPLEKVFVGEITGVEPSFPGSGMPTIRITAHDFLQRLTHGKVDRAFYIQIPKTVTIPLPDPVVAAIVSGSNLLIPDLDPVGGALSTLMTLASYIAAPDEPQKWVRKQQAQSDFDFLTAIAKENGWEMYIDHSLEPKGYVLRFQFLIQDYSPSVTLQWGNSLTDFTPRLTTVGDVFGVSARVWVASLQMEFVIVVSWDYDRAAFNLMIYPGLGDLNKLLGEKASKTISIKPTGFGNSLREILSDLLPRLNNRLTGTGSTIGNPAIKPGIVINLVGLGGQFSGLYRVTSATHAFDGSGYKTNFKVRKEVWFGGIPVPSGPSGLLRVQSQPIQ